MKYSDGVDILKSNLAIGLAVSFFLLSSCARKDEVAANAPQATITLRDGSRVMGAVVSTSPSEITINDAGGNRTIDMKTVRSIEYADAANPPAPAGGQTAAVEPTHEDHYHPEPAAVTTKSYELPIGTSVPVRVEETIDSGRAVEGQTFAAEVVRDVLDADGGVVIPRGSNAQIVIRSASKGGHFKGASDLVLDLASVSVGGQRYQLSTVNLRERGKDGVGANKRTAEFTGGGAVIGTIIGAIAGHGKGAGIGAASGAGAGLATQVLTKGGAVRVPVESVLTFRLDRPLRVAVAG